jgi:hypothetical protein
VIKDLIQGSHNQYITTSFDGGGKLTNGSAPSGRTGGLNELSSKKEPLSKMVIL